MKGRTMNINSSVAVITGAAGGIGMALAHELARRKAAGIGLVDQAKSVHELAKSINELVGHEVAAGFSGDVSDAAFRSRVYEELAQRYRRVNICVPAAGITRDSLAVKLDKLVG